MRNLKKFLALVLSVMMVLSMVVTASATSITKDGESQEFKDTADATFLTAIEVLNGMEVLKGDADPATGKPTGNFRPTDQITRAEVAALVFRLATGKTGVTDADHYAQYGNFSDVSKDAWYAGYVGYCANAGYIKGYSGEYGPFGPADPVTGYQALAMILRAMGYGVNGEFEGPSWQLNVSSVGTQTQILKKINNTHFGGATLQAPAQRQVVAEIFFEAAMTGCVVYTPAYGYQTTGVNGDINPATGAHINSLGRKFFGLVKESRIVLGNEATGEDCTLVGDLTANGDRAYEYPFVDLYTTNEAGDPVYSRTTAGVMLNVETGIELFGHKVTVYYDRDYAGGSVRRTYAIYDEAKSAVVYSKDDDLLGELGKKAADVKFDVDKREGAHTSDRYGRIDWLNGIATNGRTVKAADFAPVAPNYFLDPDGTNTTTIKEDNGDNAVLPYGLGETNANNITEEYENGGYFMLISNDGVSLDVVITLAPELARITEHNTTASVNTLRLSGKSDVSMGGVDNQVKPSTFGENDDGIIRMGSLTATSDKTLGDLVVAWEVKGTNYELNYKDEVIKGNSSMYFYQLDKIEKTYTGVVKTYNPNNGTVTLTDGKTLSFTLLPIINEAVDAPKDDVEGHNGNLYFYNGVQYTFLIDPTDSSRYVSYAQGNDYKFLYSVYADSDIGGLGSADMSYAVTGVDWDGNIKYIQPFTTIDKTKVDGTSYEALTIAKKNLGGNNSNIHGNEIYAGMYTGYGYNAETKDLDVVIAGLADENWLGIGGIANKGDTNGYATKYWDGKLASAYDNSDAADGNGWVDGVWTITKGDVADGWSEQSVRGTGVTIFDETGRLLLTPNTKFIIVDGLGVAGSSNPVTVDIRNGIADLLRDSSWATIDVNRYVYDESGVITGQNPDYNVYFLTADDDYNNYYKDSAGIDYSDDNYMVTTVILPKAAIDWNSSNNLWFTNRASATGQYLADTHADTGTIAQYYIWQNGERHAIFVDWAKSTKSIGVAMTNVNDFVEDTDVGMFFELTQINTINGEPIYKADAMGTIGGGTPNVMENVYQTNNPNTICNADLKYDYTAVNNTSTARLTQREQDIHSVDYTNGVATSDVYNVSNAKVVNLSGVGTITDVRTLNNAVSVGYDVTVAIVNNGHAVSMIYVTDVNDTNVVK